jgi:hypothetical protein
MKKAIIAIALMASASAAFAQSTTSAVTAAMAGATNAGNTQQTVFNTPGNTDATIRSAPTVYAPNSITPFSQASCIYSAPALLSLIGFGISGAAPIDGATCNWRLSTQGVQATAAGLRDLAIAGFRAVMPVPAQQAIKSAEAEVLLQKSEALMNVAVNMQCLDSDRQRAVMEKMGLCKDVADVATLDHRFGQPRNYQIDMK